MLQHPPTAVNPAKRAPSTGTGKSAVVAQTRSVKREIDQVARLFDAGGRDVLGAIESALEHYPGDAEMHRMAGSRGRRGRKTAWAVGIRRPLQRAPARRRRFPSGFRPSAMRSTSDGRA